MMHLILSNPEKLLNLESEAVKFVFSKGQTAIPLNSIYFNLNV